MKVSDYYNDMILNQKWAVEVETILCHYSLGDNSFDETSVDTYHFSVPVLGKCQYFDFPVRFFRIVNNEIILCIKDYHEV